MKAIQETGNVLLAAVDKNDSVGIIDNYFPKAAFFTEFERFDRHLEKLKRKDCKIDYISVCSPNYLHDAHIRFGLRYGADVICEKPTVLNPWNIDALQDIEKETGKKTFNILQLRLHDSVKALKKKIEEGPKDKVYDIDLTYITSRGNWYYASWKGNDEKSGGVSTNIGIHFFDMLGWIFGDIKSNIVHIHTHDRAAGYLEFDKAKVRWFLSINADTLPSKVREEGQTTHRSLQIDGASVDFSSGFSELHTKSYSEIIEGKGFDLEASRHAVETVFNIRHAYPIGLKGDYHPLCKLNLSDHPFKR
jgi:UDP-N-acetyl-2-amino-2-deoxyglucuronate dehydrogenase